MASRCRLYPWKQTLGPLEFVSTRPTRLENRVNLFDALRHITSDYPPISELTPQRVAVPHNSRSAPQFPPLVSGASLSSCPDLAPG